MANLPFRVKTYSTTLAAPGDRTHGEGRITLEKFVLYTYTIASINTNVVMAIKASFDGTTWGVVATSATHTANGTYGLSWTGAAPYIALEFESESGGTAAVITVLGSYDR